MRIVTSLFCVLAAALLLDLALIPSQSTTINPYRAVALQGFEWGTFDVERYRHISVRWRQHNNGDWECQFKNDNDSKVRIHYTVIYINSNGRRSHKNVSSLLEARSTGAGTYVRNAKNQPRIHYRGLQAIRR